MKPRTTPQPQEDDRAQLEARQDALKFAEWLETPQGQHWLESSLEYNEERYCTSAWEGWS